MTGIDAAHPDALRRDLPDFRSGDTVRVHVKVREGDKERIQIFEGVVIQRRGGGHRATFTVRKVSSGVGVERVFPVESPAVTRLEIKSRGHVRRSKLFYLRELSGKKARLRSKVRDVAALNVLQEDAAGTADAAAAAEEEGAAEVFETAGNGDGEAAAPDAAPEAGESPPESTPEPQAAAPKD